MTLATLKEERADAFENFLEQNLNKELLRFTTAGSVDDGKSTLIGRLLHDSKTVYEDQLASVKKSRINRSGRAIDFSLLTDGLRAEREQGITIDVGYRYFATARRKFIIADTPGHEQYTRNMVTGASTADLAVILIDGTKGLLPQTFRHAYIAALLGIPSVLAAVNKMDLADYSEERFLELEEKFLALAARLGIANVQCIPISALEGDNVVERSARTPWYGGPTLLEHLETAPIARGTSGGAMRLPVQYVIRPDANFRGFAGQLASGTIRVGDEVTALPSGQRTTIESIVAYGGDLEEAFAPMAVTLKLSDEIDLSRGDMLVATDDLPHVSRRFAAMLVWMHEKPLDPRRAYLIKQTTRQVRGKVLRILHRVNVNTLGEESAETLGMNEVALLELETSSPLFFDVYAQNRTTGSFIVIDPATNATVGAGMIRGNVGESRSAPRVVAEPRVEDLEGPVAPIERYRRHGHQPAIIFTGGRPELARRIERELFALGFETMVAGGPEEYGRSAPQSALNALYAAGFVVIYDHAMRDEERRDLCALAGDRVWDAAEMADSSGGSEIVSKALAFADTLRI